MRTFRGAVYHHFPLLCSTDFERKGPPPLRLAHKLSIFVPQNYLCFERNTSKYENTLEGTFLGSYTERTCIPSLYYLLGTLTWYRELSPTVLRSRHICFMVHLRLLTCKIR